MAIGKNSSKDGLLRRLLEKGHTASKYCTVLYDDDDDDAIKMEKEEWMVQWECASEKEEWREYKSRIRNGCKVRVPNTFTSVAINIFNFTSYEPLLSIQSLLVWIAELLCIRNGVILNFAFVHLMRQPNFFTA